MKERLRKFHRDILIEHRYKPQNWWLIYEDDNVFDIEHKKVNSVRRFDKQDKTEILTR